VAVLENLSPAKAEQLAVEPPLAPEQLQSHGPVPVTVEAVPALQRLVVGALVRVELFDEPHAPLISSKAEQLAVEPPLAPKQLQSHGPVPVTVEAVPVLQRLVVGALVKSALFDEPHAPLASSKAEQLAVEPPLAPKQLQSHGPAPVTVEALPLLQRLVVGALVKSALFDEPHAPLVFPPEQPVHIESATAQTTASNS
jgi:hypothetical protein